MQSIRSVHTGRCIPISNWHNVIVNLQSSRTMLTSVALQMVYETFMTTDCQVIENV